MSAGTGKSPVIVPVTSTVPFSGAGVHKFLAVTAGTLSITKSYSGPNVTLQGTFIPILTAFPVAAGQFVELDFHVGHLGGQAITAGGASGLLTTY